jgi:hypothetical protein
MVVTVTVAIIGAVILAMALGWISRFGRRRGISEARFDSKTGKEIE